MSIWQQPINIDSINNFSANTLVSHLGIKITKAGENYLEGTMPVDNRTVRQYRCKVGIGRISA